MVEPMHLRYRGALLGLAVGEAWAICPAAPAWSQRLPARLAAEALCTSILERRGFDREDQLARYRRLAETLSMGPAIDGLAPGQSPAEVEDAGAVARIAAVALYLLHDAARAKYLAAESAAVTHPSRESADACRYFAGLLVGALRGESKENLLADLYSPVYNYWFFQRTALTPRVDEVARGAYRTMEPSQVAGSRPADVLAGALLAFSSSASFEDGLRETARPGPGAAWRGAIYGQLAGAHYGADAIPAEWLERLEGRAELDGLASSLLRATAQGIRHFTVWNRAHPTANARR